MPGRDKVFGAILGAAKQHAEQKGKRDQLRAMLEPEMAEGGSPRDKLRALLSSGTMAAMDTGKVEMRKAPGAKKAEEALSTAAEFIPFVGAGKAAAEGDYGSAALQAGMDVAGGPLLKGAAALGGKFLAPALMGAIKAYHGSPYKFDKFDMSKIGTGEGAQAYGHGLYFAESPKVAADYKKNVTASKQYDFWTDEIRSKLPKALTLKEFDELGALSRKMDSGLSAKEMSRWRELKDINTNYDNAVKELTPTGNLYEVNLRWPGARESADPLGPQHFLDYDKPLSEQSKFVQDALAKIGYSVDKSKVSEYDDALLSALFGKDVLVPKEPFNPSGERIINRLTNTFGDKVAASERLGGAGIPGIRYKDAGSRSNFRVQTSYKGEPYGEPVSFMTEQQALDYAKEQKEKGFGADVMPGTSNYVLFSDELADILKRNDEQLKAIGGKKFEYPEAKPSVSGLRVGEQIKNTSSIPATFSNYEIDKGIRSVPMSAFETTNPQDLFYAKNDLERVNNLAEQIKNNGYIDPLIVAVDESGPYVLEGAHRLGALHTLGVEDIPAMVVRDLGD